MSYGMTAALQTAVYGVLNADAGLAAIVGPAVYDAMPPGPQPEIYVTLGPEKVRDKSDGSEGGALHEFSVSVVTKGAGFHLAKQAAVAVSDAVLAAPLSLNRGRVSRIHFYRANAVRTNANRRIDIWFRARLDEAVA
jgi:Protein of unknown function (DUF3168)